jgi:hypothetical protein
MKTIKKACAFIVTTFISSVSFGQLGLGAGATTQTVISATANTAAALHTTQAVTATTMAATKTTVNAASTKTAEVKAASVTKVEGTSKKAAQTNQAVKKEIKGDADVKAGTKVETSPGKASTETTLKADASASKENGTVIKPATNVSASSKTETKAVISK